MRSRSEPGKTRLPDRRGGYAFLKHRSQKSISTSLNRLFILKTLHLCNTIGPASIIIASLYNKIGQKKGFLSFLTDNWKSHTFDVGQIANKHVSQADFHYSHTSKSVREQAQVPNRPTCKLFCTVSCFMTALLRLILFSRRESRKGLGSGDRGRWLSPPLFGFPFPGILA